MATLNQLFLRWVPTCWRVLIMEYTIVTEEVIIFSSWQHVLGVSNGSNDGILLKEGSSYMIGIIHDITQKYLFGIPLDPYDTLGVHLVDGDDNGIFLKQWETVIYLAFYMVWYWNTHLSHNIQRVIIFVPSFILTYMIHHSCCFWWFIWPHQMVWYWYPYLALNILNLIRFPLFFYFTLKDILGIYFFIFIFIMVHNMLNQTNHWHQY